MWKVLYYTDIDYVVHEVHFFSRYDANSWIERFYHDCDLHCVRGYISLIDNYGGYCYDF